MSRPDITMTAAEIGDFVAAHRSWVVGAIGTDGWPVAAVAVLSAADDGLTVEIPGPSAVAGALVEGAMVCVCTDEHDRYDEIRGVSLRCRVRAVHPGADSDRGDPSCLRVDLAVEHTISFDFGRIPPA